MKKILITGSTDGIGKLAAIRMAKEGHAVYIHGRNADKVEATIAEIKAISGNDHVVGFTADFSDLKAVKAMAKDVVAKVDRLDVLINNAGIFKAPISLSKEGYELRFVVNYLAPYVLTQGVLSIMNIYGRIVNLSSAAQSDISYEAMLGKASVNVNGAYAMSKLALTMWSFYLAKQLEDTTVIAVNPGSLLNTKMANEAYGQHWSPAEKGSDIIYDLALSAEHKSHSGEYYDNDSGGYNEAHADAYDAEKVKELIELTQGILGK